MDQLFPPDFNFDPFVDAANVGMPGGPMQVGQMPRVPPKWN
jgi:hypothetical protein